MPQTDVVADVIQDLDRQRLSRACAGDQRSDGLHDQSDVGRPGHLAASDVVAQVLTSADSKLNPCRHDTLCRYLYGSIYVTPYEKQCCAELGLEPGPEPDYAAVESEFENFDLHQDPWPAGLKGQ